MTAKEYLKQYPKLNEQISELNIKLKQLEARRGYVSPSGYTFHSSLPCDKVGNLSAEIVYTKAEIARLEGLQSEIESRVSSIPDFEMREVLRLRFFKNTPAVRIGAHMYCSRETVFKRINEALAYFTGRFGDDF